MRILTAKIEGMVILTVKIEGMMILTVRIEGMTILTAKMRKKFQTVKIEVNEDSNSQN